MRRSVLIMGIAFVAVQRLVRSTLEHPLYLSKYALPSYEKVCDNS